MSLYEEIVEMALEGFEISGLRVLDAGSGPVSARALIDRGPKHLTCVCAPQDKQKLEATLNELGGRRDDATVMGVDLSVPRLFPPESFDFILADHLISEIDIFAPGKHIDVLQTLHEYLTPEGNLVVIDTEPDHPPPFSRNFSSDDIRSATSNVLSNYSENLDGRSVYRIFALTREFLYEIAQNKGIESFSKIPGDWVEKWLISVGFQDVNPQLVTRIVEIDIDHNEEERVRLLLKLVPDEKLRKYLSALLDRTEGMMMEYCPIVAEQDEYIISARKMG